MPQITRRPLPGGQIAGCMVGSNIRKVTFMVSLLSTGSFVSLSCGPHITASPPVIEERNYLCPLTGVARTVILTDGSTTSDTVSPTDVSEWVQQRGLPNLQPGQLGWEFASSFITDRDGHTRIGEGEVYPVPYRLYHQQLTLTNHTREQALQAYQHHLLNNSGEARSDQKQSVMLNIAGWLQQHDL